MSAHVHAIEPVKKGFWARVATGLVAVWLLLSLFAWTHDQVAFSNGLVVAVGTILCSILALRSPFARWMSGALGVWLICASWLTWQVNALTTWHNVIVGLLILAFSCVPGEGGRILSRGAKR